MFSKLKLSFFIIAIVFPVFSWSSDKCLNQFIGSLRQAQTVASKPFNYLPQFTNVGKELELSRHWKRKQTLGMKTLLHFLPKDVSFIHHALRESPAEYLVKFNEKGYAMIARAGYESNHKTLETNVTFTDIGILGNPNQSNKSNKWLIGPHIPAGILFLHGGGTKSTGGHVAHTLINHFRKYNIAVISPDLPWHGEGPRAVMGDLDQEIMALADFTKKYIHPKVPLFVWGHSWGGSLAHRIMQMSGEKEKNFFHKKLTGLLITSPAIDPAPGKNISEKKKSYIQRREAVFNEKKDSISPYDLDIFTNMVLDGKTSPVGEFFSSLTISQLNDKLPDHKGRNYVPSSMIVGVGDPLVYVGFEDLFHSYYDSLENVETHYLKDLPLLINPKQVGRVGHLLSDYILDSKTHTPVNFKIAIDFIANQVPQVKDFKKEDVIKEKPILSILKLYSNDLAFREWLKRAIIVDIQKSQSIFSELNKEQGEVHNKLSNILIDLHPSKWLLDNLNKNIKLSIESSQDSLKEPLAEGEVTINQIDLYKKQLAKFSSFIMHSSYAKFLLQIENITEVSELKEEIEKILSKDVPNRPGVKIQKRFLNKVISISNTDQLDDFFVQHFYIPKEKQNEIEKLVKEKIKIAEKLSETYTPNPEEFKALKLKPSKIQDRITRIQIYVENRKKLQIQENDLKKEANKIRKEINLNLTQISKQMRLVRETFESANLSPPDSLKKLYEESEKEFLDLYEFSKVLGDKIEEEATKAIENQDFSLNIIECCMNDYKDTIDEFHSRYTNFILNRKKVRQRLIQAVRNGDLTEEQADIFNNLYGDLGIYKRTDSMSLRLAEIEGKLAKISKSKAQYLLNYQKLLPYPPLSIVSILPAKNILNDSFHNQDGYSGNYDKVFQQIITEWKAIGSTVLPSLPE